MAVDGVPPPYSRSPRLDQTLPSPWSCLCSSPVCRHRWVSTSLMISRARVSRKRVLNCDDLSRARKSQTRSLDLQFCKCIVSVLLGGQTQPLDPGCISSFASPHSFVLPSRQ